MLYLLHNHIPPHKLTHTLIEKVGCSKVLTLPCAYAAAMFTDPGLETSAGFNFTGRSQGHLSLNITLVDVQVMRPILSPAQGYVIFVAQTTLECLVILWCRFHHNILHIK